MESARKTRGTERCNGGLAYGVAAMVILKAKTGVDAEPPACLMRATLFQLITRCTSRATNETYCGWVVSATVCRNEASS